MSFADFEEILKKTDLWRDPRQDKNRQALIKHVAEMQKTETALRLALKMVAEQTVILAADVDRLRAQLRQACEFGEIWRSIAIGQSCEQIKIGPPAPVVACYEETP